MAARIDLAALQRQLDGFQAKFGQWAQRAVAGAEALRDGHLARLREFQGELPSGVALRQGHVPAAEGLAAGVRDARLQRCRKRRRRHARNQHAGCRPAPPPTPRSRHPRPGAAAGGAGAARGRRQGA